MLKCLVKRKMPIIKFSQNNLSKNRYICGREASRKEDHRKKVTHCIFDVDGTLINTEQILCNLIKYICKKHGKPYSEELRQRLFGNTKRRFCEILISDLQLDATVKELEDICSQLAITEMPQAPLQTGANRLISHLFHHKVPMAIGSNFNQKELYHLAKAKPDFFGRFNHMVGVDDVENGKPAPDVFLMAAARFKEPADPASCLVFEDSTSGLRAAVAAEMQVVLTPHKNKIDQKYMSKQTEILPDLLAFNPEKYGLPPYRK